MQKFIQRMMDKPAQPNTDFTQNSTIKYLAKRVIWELRLQGRGVFAPVALSPHGYGTAEAARLSLALALGFLQATWCG